jgi:hypothetical protein
MDEFDVIYKVGMDVCPHRSKFPSSPVKVSSLFTGVKFPLLTPFSSLDF